MAATAAAAGTGAAEAQLPLYLSSSSSSSPPLDEDQLDSNRQSFPATVRESYASTWTTAAASSNRESLRGPPPPLPPKPAAWSVGIQHPPPLLQRGKSTSGLDNLARGGGGAQHELESVGQEEGSPKEHGSPSQWLDIMFGHAEGHHAPPSLSRTASGSTPSPFPSAPRLPPRPTPTPPPSTTRLESPTSAPNRTPSPSIQLTASPSLPSLIASSAPPLPSRPSQPAPPSHPSRSTQSSSSSSLPPPSSSPSAISAFNTLNQGIQHLKLKDRFAAGVGFGREWGGKGKSKVQEGWRVGQAAVNGGGGRPGSAGGGERLGTSPTEEVGFGGAAGLAVGRARSTSPLPSTILGHRIPKNSPYLAFGLPLVEVVETTRVKDEGGITLHRKKDDDPVTGDESRRWLPSVAFRCLQYLEEWGKTEEGVYRVPGRSNLVTQLRALFTSGIDLDLREIHPGDLDPHAVASLFKSWLREIPESLLSPRLEGKVEEMCVAALGCGAGGGTFLSGVGQRGSAGAGAGPATGGAPAGLVDGRAPRGFLEELRKVFAEEMEAEFFYLLRALSYHLARLSSHSGTNKMTLSNLRLILSPTLRLSPVFLQVLVEEREIIFGKTNESARSRESSEHSNPPRSPGLTSTHSSPSFSTYNSAPNHSSSSRQSPLLGPPSPRLNDLTPSPPSSTHSSMRASARRGSNSEWQAKARGVEDQGGGAEWLIIDEPSEYEALAAATASSALIGAGARGSPSSTPSAHSGSPRPPALHSTSTPPTPASNDLPPRATRTPIADRFVSTFSSGSPGARSSNGSGSELAPSIESPPPSAGLSPMAAHFSAGSTSPKLGGGGGAPIPPPKPFIPSRTTAAQASTGSGGGFFGNRSPVLGSTSSLGSNGGAGVGGARKTSVTSLTEGDTPKDFITPQLPSTTSSLPPISPIKPSYPPRSSSTSSLSTRRGAVGGTAPGGDIDVLSTRRGAVTPVELESEGLRGLGVVIGAGESEGGEKERLKERRGSVEERQGGDSGRQWNNNLGSTIGSLGGGGKYHQIPRKPVPRRASLGDQSTTSLRSSIDSSSTRPSIESTRSVTSSSTTSSAVAPVPRAPIALPSLELPAGLGLGLGVSTGEVGKQDGEDGWGLLSVEERRRFFGG